MNVLIGCVFVLGFSLGMIVGALLSSIPEDKPIVLGLKTPNP